MTGIFKQHSPANILVLLLFGMLLKLPLFLHPVIPEAVSTDTDLYRFILQALASLGKGYPALYSLIAFALVFVQALLLNGFINGNKMMTRPTYYPGMAYLLVTSLFQEWNQFSAALLVNTVLIALWGQLYRIYNHTRPLGGLFNIGLILGLSAFLFFPSIVFLLWVLLGLAFLRPFRLNEWLVCLLGTLTPSYFFGVWLFLSGQWNLAALTPHFHVGIPRIPASAWTPAALFLLALPFLSGAYYVQESLGRMLIQVRKGWTMVLFFLLCSLLVLFVNTDHTVQNGAVAAIPLAALHACTYLYASYRIFPLVLFWLSVAYVISYQYGFGPGWV